MSEEQQIGFKRVHFFKMFLTEEDWNDRHLFHIQKEELHVRQVHGKGIVQYYADELMVRQRPRAELAVDVLPGYLTDELGQDVILRERLTLTFTREEFYLPCTIYVLARFKLTPVNHIRFKDGRREHKYVEEQAEIVLLARPPEENESELARVRLSTDVYKVTDARDPYDPKDNEIDLRFRLASLVPMRLSQELKEMLLKGLRARRYHFQRIGGNKLLRPAATLGHNIAILEMLVDTDQLTPRGALALLDTLNAIDLSLSTVVGRDIDDPWSKERPDWQGFTKNCDIIRSLLSGSDPYRLGNLEQIASFMNKSNDLFSGMTSLYGNDSLVYYDGQEPMLAKTYPISDDWERVKVWSADFPEILYVDGLEWHLIDTLDMTNEADEKKFNFKIQKALDAWKTRQKLLYPDGTMVDDTGVAHEGGYSEYEIRGVVPDTHLAIIRMMDYARADYELEFIVNDQFAGVSQCIGHDRRCRWRNWPMVIPAWFVNDDVLRIKQIMTTAERDVNMFRYWFYQPLGY
ncbi:MAG: hypothetical protein AUK47_15815 [Deltaproteobacteria bacterium CG2_30_63_29]|nr:MAG: hypothetical protein AUK47_15815 [Deltaproteobacteria bacterium CG2_30_63_29]